MATQQQQIDFVNKYGGYAKDVSKQTYIPADFILGQWALETGWGTAFAGKYNLGNIQGSAAKPYDYTSEQAGVNAYTKTLSNPRYAGAKLAMSPETFGAAMKQAGYAADPDYASKIAATIKSVGALIGGGQTTLPSGQGAVMDFLGDPLGYVKNKGIDLVFMALGAGLIVFLLVNATKSEVVKAAVSEAV